MNIYAFYVYMRSINIDSVYGKMLLTIGNNVTQSNNAVTND